MNFTLVPESAPFNTEQRAWLNGFLAGWIGLQDAAVGVAPAPVPPPLSSAGPAPAPVALVAQTEAEPWHDPTLPIPERMRLAGGKAFPNRLMAAMAQLDCGACGYVCKTYSQAIADGSEKSLTLCTPGGSETSKMIKRLLKEEKEGGSNGHGHGHGHGNANGNGVAKPAEVPAPRADGWSRKNPYPARLLRGVRLNKDGSEKDTRHVEIALGEDGPAYEVGDALGVYPENCGELVDDLLAALGTVGNEPVVPPSGVEVSLREALARHCCLTATTEELLLCLANAATDPAEAAKLTALIEDDAPISGFDVLDTLLLFPSARPPAADFVAALSDLKPRLYSISSSPKRHAGQVHLTVGKVSYTFNGRKRKGVASTMFADRLGEGAEVRVFVHKAHGFTVPADRSAPMIMIGPGTGIAPFRAFLQERDAAGAPGENWLFFGDQRGAVDFLYEEELSDYLARGVLTRLDTAFSRDQDRKIYVQDRMIEHGATLFEWLTRGGHVYVCGDARRMAVDVDRALHQVIRDHGNLGEDAAKSYVARLSAEGRYCRDVY